MNALFNDPVFASGLEDMSALGFRVSDKPTVGAMKYWVIGGRANKRWWLIPLSTRRTTISGLALFQPIIASAKMLKTLAECCRYFGLLPLSASRTCYISGSTPLSECFNCSELSYAFFTGTDSPHRKLTVQIMDAEGRIKGFAKTSRTEAGKSLLVREADTLDYLKLLKLESVHVPSVVRRIDDPKSFTLVTDTLKTSRSKTATELSQAHLKFLGELSSRATSNGERDQVSAQTQIVQAALDRLTNWLPGEWKNRFDACVRIFQNEAELHTPALAHGDFTPWNTFSVNDKLYVFDWEYSGRSYPAGYDLIHFLWSSPALSRLNAETAVLALQKRLAAIPSEREKLGQETEILAYLCAHAAFYFQREFDAQRAPSEWGGESRAARAIDYLLSHC